MNGVIGSEEDCSEFVEFDPTGRYGRYNEILGKGASKTVYRAFDEYEGIEVAWNQVKLHDFLKNPEDLERLYCEIHLLKTLKHKNIMTFYTSWVDAENRNINFVTEMFTSGTLRQYRLKHKRVNIRAVKHWCRQILRALLYLHSLNPPVIHRDLKCDNIFINGNQGEVKIGDLGLAAILRKSHAERCVGTPEFMAPEVYEEEYNELVDIYAFGMCILEMVTFEYPYSECTHAAQIYKKVISGKKPEALYKVKDPEIRGFVEKCLATVSLRLNARELLDDPFLQVDGYGCDLRPIECETDFGEVGPFLGQSCYGIYQNYGSLSDDYRQCLDYERDNKLHCDPVECETSEIELFGCQENEHLEDVNIAIQGRRRDDDGLFLRLRIADKEGRIRNIYFPFDVDSDTALSVAAEMVDELEMTDQDVTRIADMIDGEISTLVPGWKKGFESNENLNCSETNTPSLCDKCASNGLPLIDYVTSENPGPKNLQVLNCYKHGCQATHSRFEEITYQVEGSEQQELPSCESNGIRYTDIWAQREGPRDIFCDEADSFSNTSKEERIITMDRQSEAGNSVGKFHSSVNRNLSYGAPFEDHGNEIRQELRWLKAKYQMQLRELRDQQLKLNEKTSSPTRNVDCLGRKEESESSSISSDSVQPLLSNEKRKIALKSSFSFKHFGPNFGDQGEERKGACNPEQMFTTQSFYSGDLVPHSLHRATSLPVDAIFF